MSEQKPKIEKEEIYCKVQKIDPRTWKLQFSDPNDSLIAEIDLGAGKFNFNYLSKIEKKDVENHSVKVGFDRQIKTLELNYKGKNSDNDNLREISMKLPLSGAPFLVESKEVVEKLVLPKTIEESQKKIQQVEKPIEEIVPIRKISLRRREYKTKNSEKYIKDLEKILTEDNIIRGDDLNKQFTSKGKRIGVKAYLRYLERKDLIKTYSDENGVYYQFLESNIPKTLQKLSKLKSARHVSKLKEIVTPEGILPRESILSCFEKRIEVISVYRFLKALKDQGLANSTKIGYKISDPQLLEKIDLLRR